jgi:hypothetical protein
MLRRHVPHAWPQALDMYLTEYERAHAPCPALALRIRHPQFRYRRPGPVAGE